ncbi:hypothetical protein [Zavarzinella formosa]|uniref:hypothetical protein n=1 Tax=Zavarzinella formosa TaxID=360055 RepID=UPI0002D91312|nr:hypothetical protein [Zavarzinella formosa]
MRLTMFVLLLATTGYAAPAPKNNPAVYFPTVMGDTRVYETQVDGKATNEFTDRVTKVEKKERATLVTVERHHESSEPFVTTIAVREDGLFRVALGPETLAEPVLLLKLPAKAGVTWDVMSGNGKTSHTIVKEEEVTVPAGKFKTIRVEIGADKDSLTTLWFAPTAGLVKMSSGNGTRVMVLKQFKAGN